MLQEKWQYFQSPVMEPILSSSATKVSTLHNIWFHHSPKGVTLLRLTPLFMIFNLIKSVTIKHFQSVFIWLSSFAKSNIESAYISLTKLLLKYSNTNSDADKSTLYSHERILIHRNVSFWSKQGLQQLRYTILEWKKSQAALKVNFHNQTSLTHVQWPRGKMCMKLPLALLILTVKPFKA